MAVAPIRLIRPIGPIGAFGPMIFFTENLDNRVFAC
jgi:hypothetical protein